MTSQRSEWAIFPAHRLPSSWPLADAPSGTVHDPDTDDIVQAELAAEAAAADAREAELQALRELGPLAWAEPRDGDEAVRDELTRRADGYIQTDVDAWLPRYVFRGPARGPLASGPGMTVAPCRRHDLGGGVTGPGRCRRRR
ncbi:hypothetical protein [Streptomyces pratensis]|uniref:hypothetical protein n=1 Tax=Streptomyces pratensis TaxID=1169025 RepID=UPI0030159630